MSDTNDILTRPYVALFRFTSRTITKLYNIIIYVVNLNRETYNVKQTHVDVGYEIVIYWIYIKLHDGIRFKLS